MSDPIPVPPQVQQLIDSSGNTFHARVAKWLQSNGWAVRVSPYYLDQSQGKAREIDIVAEKVWPIHDRMRNQFLGDVIVRLFVECKFVNTHSVFWLADKDSSTAAERVYATRPFERHNTYSKRHHYLASSPRVAKVFATERSSGLESEWPYKALNQVLNGLVSMNGQSPFSPDTGRRQGQRVTLDFPVVVCSSFDKLYKTSFSGDDVTARIVDNFQLEVQYAFTDRSGNGRDDYFLVDVVEYPQLESFAQLIEEDAQVAVFLAAD